MFIQNLTGKILPEIYISNASDRVSHQCSEIAALLAVDSHHREACCHPACTAQDCYRQGSQSGWAVGDTWFQLTAGKSSWTLCWSTEKGFGMPKEN